MLGWGIPIYQLNSTMSTDGSSKEPIQLFLFKVVIPGIANSTPGAGTYVPNKVCKTVDDAQNYASEYVLMSLGMPYDGTGGVLPSPVLPGMIPSSMQPLHMGAALNYLGNPITSGQLPGTIPSSQGMADFNALSAAYAMQGMPMPGMPSTANMIHPNQALLFGNNEMTNGIPTIQTDISAAQMGSMGGVTSMGVAVSSPADISVAAATAASLPSFNQY